MATASPRSMKVLAFGPCLIAGPAPSGCEGGKYTFSHPPTPAFFLTHHLDGREISRSFERPPKHDAGSRYLSLLAYFHFILFLFPCNLLTLLIPLYSLLFSSLCFKIWPSSPPILLILRQGARVAHFLTKSSSFFGMELRSHWRRRLLSFSFSSRPYLLSCLAQIRLF